MSIPPHDLDAERRVIGVCLSSGKDAIERTARLVAPEDFYLPAHGALFATMLNMVADGTRVDFNAVAERARVEQVGLTNQELLSVMADADYNPDAPKVVARYAAARQVLSVLTDVAHAARPATMDPPELFDLARAAIGDLTRPVMSGVPDDLMTVRQFCALDESAPSPWAVPGLLRQNWRCMVVAPEGAGKSYLSRTLAVASAQGIHPLTHRPIPPICSLIIDLENPSDVIADACRPIDDFAATKDGYQENRAWIANRPEGVNLRSRADRVEIESMIAAVRPDLVCLGPIYKAYTVEPRESDEYATKQLTAILDTWRIRYGFALFLEHHAPKAQSMGVRDLFPAGSAVWMRWPELGFKLIPSESREGSLEIGRFRRDRVKHAWPARLDRGQAHLPVAGNYPNGVDEAAS